MRDRKRVLIIGAGHRIGALIAKDFLKRQWDVLAHYRSTKDELQQFIAENPIYYSRLEWWKADFSASTEELDSVPWKTIDAVIISISIFETGNLFDSDNWRDQLEINALIPIEIIRAFVRHGTGGQIIAFIDANIRTVHRRFQNYRLSKLFLETAIVQAAATIPQAFRLNAISPGTVLPPESGDPESYFRAVESSITQREVKQSSIVSALWYLIENEDVVGEILHVDGGVHLR